MALEPRLFDAIVKEMEIARLAVTDTSNLSSVEKAEKDEVRERCLRVGSKAHARTPLPRALASVTLPGLRRTRARADHVAAAAATTTAATSSTAASTTATATAATAASTTAVATATAAAARPLQNRASIPSHTHPTALVRAPCSPSDDQAIWMGRASRVAQRPAQATQQELRQPR